MAPINPADTAITSKLPSACLAIPRLRANQAGRWSSIAAEQPHGLGGKALHVVDAAFFARVPFIR